MKTKSKTTIILQILTGVGGVVYFIGMAMSFLFDELTFLNLIDYMTLVLLLIFIAGFAFSWTNNKMAGILLMSWNAGVWISDLYLFREMDYSMLSAIASPSMVIGSLFLLEWYKTYKETLPSAKQQWKFILRVLLINYAVLYSIVVFSELLLGDPVDYLSFPFIIYPLLLLLFFVGFLLSWKRELLSGFIFLFWCAILVYGNFAYSEIGHLGPWVVFGLPILLQGIFYIINHYKFRPK
ncbi:MAG: hypothetical protein C0592_13055 [Marinilabiliales bacterium]|nr:MAG: hypothetical protein C0592_13055 [Marinilabiliales bacterium]